MEVTRTCSTTSNKESFESPKTPIRDLVSSWQWSCRSPKVSQLPLALTLRRVAGSCTPPRAAASSSRLRTSKSSVEQMIGEGVQGSAKWRPGLSDLLKGKPRLAHVPLGNPYAAARAYNSGEVGENLGVVSRGQPGYVNDIANRLQGWNGRGTVYTTCG